MALYQVTVDDVGTIGINDEATAIKAFEHYADKFKNERVELYDMQWNAIMREHTPQASALCTCYMFKEPHQSIDSCDPSIQNTPTEHQAVGGAS